MIHHLVCPSFVSIAKFHYTNIYFSHHCALCLQPLCTTVSLGRLSTFASAYASIFFSNAALQLELPVGVPGCGTALLQYFIPFELLTVLPLWTLHVACSVLPLVRICPVSMIYLPTSGSFRHRRSHPSCSLHISTSLSSSPLSADGGGVSIPCGALLTRGYPFPFPGWFKLNMHGRSYHPGMEPDLLRVQRDLKVVPRSDCRHVLAPRIQDNRKKTHGVGVSTRSGATST